MTSLREMLRRFPGLAALGGARVPFIGQRANGECGAACIAMLACHFGRATSLEDVIELTGSARTGMRMGEMQGALTRLNMTSRLVKLHDIDELRWLDRPVVLHWRFSHFVVLERFDGRTARVLDPALGPREIDREELDAAYTGVMLWVDHAPVTSARPPRKPLWPFLSRYLKHLAELPGLLVLCAILQGLALLPALLSSYAFGTLLPTRDAGMMVALSLGALTVSGLYPVMELARNFLVVQVRGVLNLRMLTELVEQVLRVEWKLLQQRSVGDLLTRIQANDEIRNLLTGTGAMVVLDLCQAVLALAILLWVAPGCAGLVALLAMVFGARLWFLQRRRLGQLTELFACHSRSHGYLVQMLAGMETVRASGLHEGVRRSWSTGFAREAAATAALGRTEGHIAAASVALQFSGGLVALIAIGYGALQGGMSLPLALLAYNLSLMLLSTAGKLFLGAQQLQSVRFQAGLAQDLLDLPRQDDAAAPAPDGGGALRCEHVSFSHANNTAPTLRDITLDIGAGKLVAIVGPSGCGKSTLLSLIAGLYRADQGQVWLDDTDTATVPADALRERVILVPQFPYFFSQSIRENLLLADGRATLEQIRAACRGAGIADEIEALPMGYETPLGDGGAGLSGGQRQRLAVARALLRAPRVLLLDEATSSLDARTEQSVLSELAQWRCTRVIAAHRLSTVRHADHIVVLDAGQIVQQGSFTQLAQQPGPFRRLFGRQLATDNDNADAA